jgi:hypothetical protein
MKQPCVKCENLRVTLNWSARPVLTKQGSGEILDSTYIDRLLNADFYPADKKPEESLDDWPICPNCKAKIPMDGLEPFNPEPPATVLTGAWVLLAFVFSAFLLLLLLF